ncbi:MAG: hypothetical protein PHW69_03605 [Elusimicrobiaceae bacterium]|nr:hypothetical protein [Elusimicrobiaceae bacterium]
MNVLFVCTGNVNRSFVAEKYAAFLAGSGGAAVSVDSAGIAAQSYYRVPPQASAFLAAAGIADVRHTAKLVTEELVNRADLILVMEHVHYGFLADKYPQSIRKMHLFLDYCHNTSGRELPDPMGKSDAVFLAAFNAIKSGLQACQLFQKQVPPLNP